MGPIPTVGSSPCKALIDTLYPVDDTEYVSTFFPCSFGKRLQRIRSTSIRSGFTLIELLIVIGILGILFTTVLIAVNPARQFAQAKNTKRKSDLVALLNATQQYLTDHGGELPAAVSGTPTAISKAGVDLCDGLVPVYVAALPVDPEVGGPNITHALCTSSYDTGYVISQDASEKITVAAPYAEFGEVISYTR